MPFSQDAIKGLDIAGVDNTPGFNAINVEVDAKLLKEYERTKQKLIDEIGIRDPHTIPRNLYLMSGKAKLGSVEVGGLYIGRNNRFKLPNFGTFRDEEFSKATVFELCHNFINFADFLVLSGQRQSDVLVADTKVDRWYFDRYVKWAERIGDAYNSILK